MSLQGGLLWRAAWALSHTWPFGEPSSVSLPCSPFPWEGEVQAALRLLFPAWLRKYTQGKGNQITEKGRLSCSLGADS